MKRLALILMLLVLVLPAFAQTPGTQYPRDRTVEIVRADYGWGNRWVDVTERVRSLARNGVLGFQVHADHLRVDPNRGGPKLLRLQIRESDGDRRMIEFREGEYVNLNIRDINTPFSGTQYPRDRIVEIVRADYGWGDRWVDVTERVRSLVGNGVLSFQVHADHLRVDPNRGGMKLLRLQIRESDGDRRTLEFREGEYVNLNIRDINAPFSGTQYPRDRIVEIVRADYGWENRWVDVTQQVRSLVGNGVLSFQVHADHLRVDPNRGGMKLLRLQIRESDGDRRTLEFREGEYVNLNIREGSGWRRR